MTNQTLFEQAKRVLPGGVCASVRLNQGLGHPVYVAHAEGARFTDVDGREYVDMCCSHGAALLGHGPPAVREAMARAADLGICCSFDTPHHVALAETLCRIIPCAERVRFTNSGTEATLHALRLCRAFTGRDQVIRFLGHFHGYHEYTYVGGHPPKEALDHPSAFRESAGIPAAMSEFIVAVSFNDLNAVEQAIHTHRDEVGTVILEPVNYNSGCILPQPGYLEGLRQLTEEYGLLLFFDEILSSFRNSSGGVQEDFGVVPDLCTIGKALGGGLPLSAICGRADLMDRFKPVGDVQHSGTFNAPLTSILGGLAFCEEIMKSTFYPQLRTTADRFYIPIHLEMFTLETYRRWTMDDGRWTMDERVVGVRGLWSMVRGLRSVVYSRIRKRKIKVIRYTELDVVIRRVGVPVVAPRHGARFGLLMGLETPPVNYRDALDHRTDIMLAFVRETAQRGVYFHDYGGSACHHGFSAAHTDDDLAQVLDGVEGALRSIKDMFTSGVC